MPRKKSYRKKRRKMTKLARIRETLRDTEKLYPQFYAAIEKNTFYPNEDDFDDPRKYDEAVDRAEYAALKRIKKTELT